MAETLSRVESPAELKRIAYRLRQDALKMIASAKSGHPGGSLSCIDALVALYWGPLKHDPKQPESQARDRVILSKGHACPALYAVLGEQGYFDKALFPTFRQLGSPLQGHPELGKVAGAEASTGSLGQGLSIGLGHAEGCRLQKGAQRVYVLMGDGELNEGQVWEAAMYAAARGVDNLCAIADINGQQLDDTTAKLMPMEPMRGKWEAFGWHVIEVDGHDHAALLKAYDEAAATKGKPSVILLRTIKGKGVSFMEDNLAWHGAAPNPEQLQQALAELDAVLAAI